MFFPSGAPPSSQLHLRFPSLRPTFIAAPDTTAAPRADALNTDRFVRVRQARDVCRQGGSSALLYFLAGLAAQIHFGDWEAAGVRDAGDY